MYLKLELGDHFGHIDLGCNKEYFNSWKVKKARRTKQAPLRRNFNIQALENCDLLTLTLDALEKMYNEFPDICSEIIA